MPVITIRVMRGADVLKTEGLVLKSMPIGHMGAGCQVEQMDELEQHQGTQTPQWGKVEAYPKSQGQNKCKKK